MMEELSYEIAVVARTNKAGLRTKKFSTQIEQKALEGIFVDRCCQLLHFPVARARSPRARDSYGTSLVYILAGYGKCDSIPNWK